MVDVIHVDDRGCRLCLLPNATCKLATTPKSENKTRMASSIVRKSLNRWLTIWLIVAHVGLCAAIITLGFVAVDRSHIPLVFGLLMIGSICWIICWRWGDFNLRIVILYAVLFRLTLMGLPPSLSDDAYRYVWDGLVQQNGINPYRLAPEDVTFNELQQDITFTELNSKAHVSVYPPVSQLVFRLGTTWHTPDSLAKLLSDQVNPCPG